MSVLIVLLLWCVYQTEKPLLSTHVVYGMGQEVLFWKIEKSQ